MRYTDIAIIGGGLAGSTAAAMLGRAGIAALLIDPHEIYPFDFRVEKLSGGEQVDRFARTGLADAVLPTATLDGENWIARWFGWGAVAYVRLSDWMSPSANPIDAALAKAAGDPRETQRIRAMVRRASRTSIVPRSLDPPSSAAE